MYLLGFFIFLFSPCFADVFVGGFFTKKDLLYTDVLEREFVASIENALVYRDGAIIKDGKIFSDTETYGKDQQKIFGTTISDNIIQKFTGRLVVLSSPGQENWYHWLLQVLPRLKILCESGVEYDALYVNKLDHAWQKESLKIVLQFLNIPESKLFTSVGDLAIQPSTLIVPSIPFAPTKGKYFFPEWATSFLRDCFLIKNNNILYPKKLYISRSKASSRRIINEDSFMNMLKKEGFIVVHLENLSPIEQACIFNAAEVIIGSHGSAFANLVFSKEKTLVVEIDHGLKDSPQRSHFGNFAKRFGCTYIPFYVDIVTEDALDSDFLIDCHLFDCFYKSLYENEKGRDD